MVATLLIGMGIGAAATPDEDERPPMAHAHEDMSMPSSAATTVEEPTEPANLDGTWVVTSCDLQPFTAGTDTSTLVGAVEVENTGNVPALFTVSLKWDALPGRLFDGGTWEVSLNPGASRELLFVKKIHGNNVNRVQSSPGYKGAGEEEFCKVSGSIDAA